MLTERSVIFAGAECPETGKASTLTKLLSLTLNDRGLGFELNGVSLILTGIAKFISMVKQADTLALYAGA